MGGRGASSGTYYLTGGKLHKYGDEYVTFLQSGNIKFVQRINDVSRKGKLEPTKSPIESQTPNRIYVTVNKATSRLHSITYMDSSGKRYKTIDYQDHHGMGAHVHDGYNHNRDRRRKMSKSERRMFRMVNALYARFRSV